MDPLSFAAGIIAVLNLAGSLGGALKKLHRLQHASDEFLALVNEISDFQAVLSNVVDAMWIPWNVKKSSNRTLTRLRPSLQVFRPLSSLELTETFDP